MKLSYAIFIGVFFQIFITSCCTECDKGKTFEGTALTEDEKKLLFLDRAPGFNTQLQTVFKNSSGDSIQLMILPSLYERRKHHMCKCRRVVETITASFKSKCQGDSIYFNSIFFNIEAVKDENQSFNISYTIGNASINSVETLNNVSIGGIQYSNVQLFRATNASVDFKKDTLNITEVYYTSESEGGIVKFVQDGSIEWIKQ